MKTRLLLFCFLVVFSAIFSCKKTAPTVEPSSQIETAQVDSVSSVIDSETDSVQAVADTTSNVEATSLAPADVLDSAIELTEKGAVEGVVSFGKILVAALFVLVTYLFLLLLTRVLTALSEYSTNYRILFKRTIPIVRISVWAISIYIIVAGIFSPPYETVIAFFASVGVAIGFASQDILKNVFGGLVILFDRPFQVGDKIDMGGHYGEVFEIGLRSVRIVTAGDSVVTIPNAVIMNNSVSNSNTGETNCLVETEIYLPLDTDMNKARAIAIEASQVATNVFLRKPISVLFFNEYKDRQPVIKMIIKAYVSDPRNELVLKSQITELVIPELLSCKIAGFFTLES